MRLPGIVCFLFVVAIIFLASCKPKKTNTSDALVKTIEKFQQSYDNHLETINPDSALKLAMNIISNPDKIRDDSTLYNAYTQASIIFDNKSLFDSALYYLENAHQIAKEKNNSQQIAKALHLLGGVYISTGNYTKARDLIHQALQMNRNSGEQSQIASNYTSLGLIHHSELHYDSALFYYQLSENMFDSLHDPHSKAIVLANIAGIYNSMEAYKKALPILKNLALLNDSLGNLQELASVYNRMGISYLNLKQYDSAIINLNQSLRYAEQLGLEFDALIARFNLGKVFSLDGKYNEGNEFIEKVYQYCNDNDIIDGKLRCLLRLGRNNAEQEKPELAEQMFSQGLSLAEEFDYPYFRKEFLDELTSLKIRQSGDHDLALWFRKLRQVEDSINYQEMQEKVLEYEARYEAEKKESQLALLSQQNKFQKVRSKNLLIISILLLLTAIFVLIYFRKRNQLLRQKHEAILQKNKLHQILLDKNQLEIQLKNETIGNQQLKIKQKEQELVFSALNKARFIEMFHQFRDQLLPFQFKLKTKADQKDFIDQVERINKANNVDPMKDFETLFQDLHPGFFKSLSQTYPGLSSREMQICAMIRLNMNTKEIASITFLAPASIDTARYRIRKRMNLPSDQSLVNELMKF